MIVPPVRPVPAVTEITVPEVRPDNPDPSPLNEPVNDPVKNVVDCAVVIC